MRLTDAAIRALQPKAKPNDLFKAEVIHRRDPRRGSLIQPGGIRAGRMDYGLCSVYSDLTLQGMTEHGVG